MLAKSSLVANVQKILFPSKGGKLLNINYIGVRLQSRYVNNNKQQLSYAKTNIQRCVYFLMLQPVSWKLSFFLFFLSIIFFHLKRHLDALSSTEETVRNMWVNLQPASFRASYFLLLCLFSLFTMKNNPPFINLFFYQEFNLRSSKETSL